MGNMTYRMYVITPMLLRREEAEAMNYNRQNHLKKKKKKRKRGQLSSYHMSASSPSGS